MNILIDTNIALYLFGGDSGVADVLERHGVHVSFVTELELLGYPDISKREEGLIRDFLEHCVIMDLNQPIKQTTIEFRRQYGLKLPDSIVAATAWYLGAPLFTADTDFCRVSEIDLMLYQAKA